MLASHSSQKMAMANVVLCVLLKFLSLSLKEHICLQLYQPNRPNYILLFVLILSPRAKLPIFILTVEMVSE